MACYRSVFNYPGEQVKSPRSAPVKWEETPVAVAPRTSLLSYEDIATWQAGGSRAWFGRYHTSEGLTPNLDLPKPALDDADPWATDSTHSRDTNDPLDPNPYSTCSSANSACASLPYSARSSDSDPRMTGHYPGEVSDDISDTSSDCSSGFNSSAGYSFSEFLRYDEYTEDTYRFNRQGEMKCHPVACLADQPQVTVEGRSMLVEWLTGVCRMYEYGPETLFLNINLVDRFLAKVPITRGCLQLLGIAAFFVAAKKLEVYPPSMSELVQLCARAYDRRYVRQMELAVLRQLKFDLCVPTAYYFLEYYLQERTANRLPTPRDRVVRSMSRSLLESSLRSYSLCQKPPSLLALAVLRSAQAFSCPFPESPIMSPLPSPIPPFCPRGTRAVPFQARANRSYQSHRGYRGYNRGTQGAGYWRSTPGPTRSRGRWNYKGNNKNRFREEYSRDPPMEGAANMYMGDHGYNGRDVDICIAEVSMWASHVAESGALQELGEPDVGPHTRRRIS